MISFLQLRFEKISNKISSFQVAYIVPIRILHNFIYKERTNTISR